MPALSLSCHSASVSGTAPAKKAGHRNTAPIPTAAICFVLEAGGRMAPDLVLLSKTMLPQDPGYLVDAFAAMSASVSEWIHLWSLYSRDFLAMEIVAEGALFYAERSIWTPADFIHAATVFRVMLMDSWKFYAMSAELDIDNALRWIDIIQDAMDWCREYNPLEFKDTLDALQSELRVMRRARLQTADAELIPKSPTATFATTSAFALLTPERAVIHCPMPTRTLYCGRMTVTERLEAVAGLLAGFEDACIGE